MDNFFTASSLGFGEILLLLSLTCDGLTGAIQERMKSDHKTKSGHMMTNMNMWSFLMLGVTLLITGELLEFVNFVSRHPDILWQLASVCIAMSLGQVISRNFFGEELSIFRENNKILPFLQHFIFMCISEYGPLPTSIITTTRKCVTVLFSVLFFGNKLTGQQWIGAGLVFAG